MEIAGTVVRVAGVVVDAEFPSGDLPSIHNALIIDQQLEQQLVVEVQEHEAKGRAALLEDGHLARQLFLEGAVVAAIGLRVSVINGTGRSSMQSTGQSASYGFSWVSSTSSIFATDSASHCGEITQCRLSAPTTDAVAAAAPAT